MADIAGIIEGAHKGLGLGLKFLKHIERTRVLIHVVDASGSEGRDPIEDFDKIMAELALYSKRVAEKPMLVAANKMDMIDEDDPEVHSVQGVRGRQGLPALPDLRADQSGRPRADGGSRGGTAEGGAAASGRRRLRVLRL